MGVSHPPLRTALKTTAKSFLGFNPVNNRVISLRLKSHPFNTTSVQVYDPTSTASDDDGVEEFYGQVQDTFDKMPRTDVLIVMGILMPRLVSPT
jgi:hypothetical protein